VSGIRRRDFVILLGGGAAAWPLAARAQQGERVRRVGVIGPRPENAGFSGGVGAGYPAMLDELRKLGFSEGRNLAAEFRSVEQEPRSVYAAAVELVRSNPDVLVAIGPELGLQAVVAATSTIPIVIAAFNYDPIARGYVKSLAQPGGNITGVFLRLPELAEKQVELLTQTFPDRTRLALLWDDLSSDQFSAAERRAKSLHLQALPMRLERPPYDFDVAFRLVVESSPQMLLILSSPHFIAQRQRIAELAIEHRLPAMSIFKFYVEAGGLMSYGVDTVLPFRRAGHHVAKILRGAKPADLPVEQVTNFETVINLKTAKAIGIELPTSILLRADEVIE
jgi:putative tryptophan/tyrosine transport system substrate-binding protein